MKSSDDAVNLNSILKKLRELKPQLETKWGITELAVFGSVARGEATANSDIDIMINYTQLSVPAFIECCDFLEAQLQKPVDVHTKPAIRPRTWQFIADEMRYV